MKVILRPSVDTLVHEYASYIALHSATTCCSSVLSHRFGAMVFAFVIRFGDSENWMSEGSISIVFLQGEFTMLAFAEAVCPIARCIPNAMPAGTNLHSWTWSGYVTWRCPLRCQEQL